MTRIGEIAALSAALLWTSTSLIIERKGKNISPTILNFYRMFLGLILVSLVMFFKKGFFISKGSSLNPWLWLMGSGVIGFAFGDVFLFKSYQLIGARLTLLIYSFNPVIITMLSFLIFGEKLSLINLLGIIVIFCGILLVVTKKKVDKLRGKNINFYDLIPAFMACFGQAVGVIFSKLGMVTLDPLDATQMRLAGGLIGMIILLFVSKNLKGIVNLNWDKDSYLTIGYVSIIGTFIAVFLSMIAIKNTPAAIASILMSTQPVLILPISRIFTKEKVQLVEIIGAFMTFLGVALLILK